MVPSEIDLILSQDLGGLNDGSFFIRNTETMQLFLDFFNDPLLIDFADEHQWSHWDQDLFLHLIFHHPKLRRRIGWVDQNTFNSFWEDGPSGSWRPGDLVVHFPSCAYAYLYVHVLT
jgi:hypothetical protein